MNVVGQLFQFLRFGREGYTEVCKRMMRTMQVRGRARQLALSSAAACALGGGSGRTCSNAQHARAMGPFCW